MKVPEGVVCTTQAKDGSDDQMDRKGVVPLRVFTKNAFAKGNTKLLVVHGMGGVLQPLDINPSRLTFDSCGVSAW